MQSTRGMKESKSREKESVLRKREKDGGQTRDEINKIPSSHNAPKTERSAVLTLISHSNPIEKRKLKTKPKKSACSRAWESETREAGKARNVDYRDTSSSSNGGGGSPRGTIRVANVSGLKIETREKRRFKGKTVSGWMNRRGCSGRDIEVGRGRDTL